MVRRRQTRRVPGEFVLGVITDTVLDLRTEEGPVTTVAELNRHLDHITGEIADYRVRPVEVGLYDNTDVGAPGLALPATPSTTAGPATSSSASATPQLGQR